MNILQLTCAGEKVDQVLRSVSTSQYVLYRNTSFKGGGGGGGEGRGEIQIRKSLPHLYHIAFSPSLFADNFSIHVRFWGMSKYGTLSFSNITIPRESD